MWLDETFSGKGVVYVLPQSWGGVGASDTCTIPSAISMDAATVPIAMTTPSPKLIPVLVPGTAAHVLRNLGLWAGPATSEVE